jgi:hypothetical protein
MVQLRIAVCALAVLGATTSVGLAQAPPTASPKAGETTAGSGASSPMTPTEQKAFERLEELGYTDIRNVRSGPEGTSAKAIKDGKQVSVVVDSSGHVKEQ